MINRHLTVLCNARGSFYNKSVEVTDTVLKKYAKSWVRPAVAKDLARYEKQGEEEKQSGLKREYQPRGVQIEALYELEKSRKEGAEKGIVHAATGIGKTYLAAFDSLPYKRVYLLRIERKFYDRQQRHFIM